MWHTIAYWAGLTDPSSVPYLWWSGIGSKIGLSGLAVVLYRRHRRTQRAHHAELVRAVQDARDSGAETQ